MTDIVNSTHYLYYSTLKKNRDIYKAEGYNELLSYVRIGNSIEPWRCREFFDDVELVEQFLNRFPDSRFEMRMFLNKLLTFTCEYNWSDMIEPKLEIDNNDSIDDINLNDLKKESEKLSEYYKVYYLKKTEEDLGNDLPAALTMQKLLSPPKMGGVKIKYPKEYSVWWHRAAVRTRNEYNLQKEIEKMIKRADLVEALREDYLMEQNNLPWKAAGEKLRMLIKENYRTQEEFAFQYGIDVRTVRRYLSQGIRDLELLHELAIHFKIQLTDFFKLKYN